MKFFLIAALIAIAKADVSHLQGGANGYVYSPPARSFEAEKSEPIPQSIPTVQYLPPVQESSSAQVAPSYTLPSPQTQYLPPESVGAVTGFAATSSGSQQNIVSLPSPAPAVISQYLPPTLAPQIPEPVFLPAPAPVVSQLPAASTLETLSNAVPQPAYVPVLQPAPSYPVPAATYSDESGYDYKRTF